MLSLRLFVLFIHVTAVIVALGGSLFSTFALAPVLAEELDGASRVRVARRVIRRLGVIVLSALVIRRFSSTARLGYGYGESRPTGPTRRSRRCRRAFGASG